MKGGRKRLSEGEERDFREFSAVKPLCTMAFGFSPKASGFGRLLFLERVLT